MVEKCNDSCGNISIEGASETYKKILWIVVAINAAMFLLEATASFFADSMALRADALDFLGDTATYAITICVLGRSLKTRAKVALIKGLSLGGMALFVLGSTIYRVFVLGSPEAFAMGAIGFMALFANLLSVFLLLRYKEGDSNVRSVWLCSRNDAIGNVAVILAGAGVFMTKTSWPDLIAAFLVAGLFMHSSVEIIRQALAEMRDNV